MEKFVTITSRTAVLAQDNIDTDQIIPARFLTTTTREGLGAGLFYDWRYDDNGRPRNSSVFNGINPEAQKVLVAGSNFGCGSSREHAPWALIDFGFEVVISSDIADIFKSNALKNGLLPVEVDIETHRYLLANPDVKIEVDLENQSVVMPGGKRASFKVEAFARYCLVNGVDPLGYLIDKIPAIEEFEEHYS